MMSMNTNNNPSMFEYFERVITHQQLSHGYAFTGPNDSLKTQVTQYIIKSLACQSGEPCPCGSCSMCQRIERNQFADVLYVKPEGLNIKVDQIRQLKDWLSTSPVEANFKFAVIEQAETMNAAAANALLTFLEEPLADIYLILYSSDFYKLLPTIQSRVQQLYFRQDYQPDFAEQLLEQGINSSHVSIIQAFPMDMVNELIETYDSESFNEWIKALNYFYQLLVQKDLYAFVSIQTHLKYQLTVQTALLGLEYLTVLNHAVLMTQVNSNDQTDFQSFYIQELLKRNVLDIKRLLKLNQELVECRQHIQANVSPQLAFETLALKMTSEEE